MKRCFGVWLLICLASVGLTAFTSGCGGILEGSDSSPGSFAIITDLHIGYGVPDYYPDYLTKPGFGWLDKAEGYPGNNNQNKFCAEKLKAAVDTIIKSKNSDNIKFIVILGDISDTAEYSEFQVTWQILSKLNDAGIAYLLLIGNHDIWPYTQPEDKFDPANRENTKDVSGSGIGDRFFEEIFWGDANNKNISLIKKLFGQSWERSQNPVDLSSVFSANLQNFGFYWNGITFLGLDLVPRDKNSIFSNPYPGEMSLAVEHKQTIDFSLDYFSRHIPNRKIAILFSHYPLGSVEGFRKYLVESKCSDVYYFSGHEHAQDVNNKFLDVSTHEILVEDNANIDLFLTDLKGRKNTPICIVKINKDGVVNCSNFLAREIIPSEIIAKAQEQLLKIDTFHFELDHSNGLTQLKDIIGTDVVGMKKISGDVVLPDKISSKVTVSLSAINFIGKSFDIKLIGNTFYYNYLNGWKSYEGIDYQTSDQMASVSNFLDKITAHLEKLDDQSVDGIECYHLSGQIDSEDIGFDLPDNSLITDFWVAKSTFHIRQLKIQGKILANDNEKITRTIKFSKFNQPAIEIVPP
jgi:hypothetical protein